jgi:signal transduction histidine kinase
LKIGDLGPGTFVRRRPARHVLAALAIGAGALAVATMVKAVLLAWTGDDPAYLIHFAALPLAVLAGGFISGVVLVVAGALLDSLIFQVPLGSLWIADPDARLRLILFVPVGLWIAWLIASVADARSAAADAAVRVRRLLDALPDATFVIDPTSGRIEYANRAALESTGQSDGLQGVEMDRVVPGWAAALDAPPAELAMARLVGDDLPVGLVVRTVSRPGRDDGVLAIAHDLTDRIDAEVRLMRLAAAERAQTRLLTDVIASMDEGVALVDTDGRVLVANVGLNQLLGRPVTSRADLEAALGTSLQDGDVRLPASERWAHVRVRTLGDEASGARLVVVRDISQEIEAVAIRDAFLGVLSHELRTPVTTILGYSQVARRSRHSPEASAEALIDDIAAEAERLHHLIEDLLVLSRAQAGDVPFEPEPLLLQHVVADILASEAARHPEVDFTQQVAPSLPAVDGDRTYVGQIMRNLIGNAVKYGRPDHGRVHVSVSVEARDGTVEVRVLDKGPGFQPGDEERLFEIFYRAQETARQRSGSGIGLYVTRTLVEAMGGTAWARLPSAGGSEFGFALRIASADDEDLG